MKAQVSFEYYFSLVLFVMLAMYVVFQTISVTSVYRAEVRNRLIKAEAYQISELLVNDLGEPINWDISSEVKRIGLSDESMNKTNLLSTAKIRSFNNSCSTNYQLVASQLGITEDYQFEVFVTDLTSNTLLASCSPPTRISRGKVAEVTRIAALDSGSYVRIIVMVW
jgi:hypothetical protein